MFFVFVNISLTRACTVQTLFLMSCLIYEDCHRGVKCKHFFPPSPLTLRYTSSMSEIHWGLPMLGLHEFIIKKIGNDSTYYSSWYNCYLVNNAVIFQELYYLIILFIHIRLWFYKCYFSNIKNGHSSQTNKKHRYFVLPHASNDIVLFFSLAFSCRFRSVNKNDINLWNCSIFDCDPPPKIQGDNKCPSG